ncbi:MULTISPECIES: ribose 5-phosphate isomerase B [unclassified Paenibacillus]|uniref:ribose 5-phosphate isomerase B n=1 Tax=unclassified Paenibacillus TaxID=185978 RepID=UPI001C10FCFD|nr:MULTISPECIES: ribose 5-phosphate isomerase B [unclassified Paenibacillus]MBU5444176.1 ribose 5-phosphate isomerase B [Paenibacillus sp. MSJ-34]CAH0122546.1 D-erythrulose-4-phosphate isomerase [Paenibacillus sp. CECT 9249]
MKIGLGSDHFGFELKELVKQYLVDMGHQVVDYGCHSCDAVDYPDVAFKVAKDIQEEKLPRGILICGTGIGVAIAAGKVPGIRAALCHDTYSAERARKSNNAQVLTMGAKVIGPETAKKVVEAWIHSEFEGGNSGRKIQKIMDQEADFLNSFANKKEVESLDSGSCS